MSGAMNIVMCGSERYGQERQYEGEADFEADKPRILRERAGLLRHLNGIYVRYGVKSVVTDGTHGSSELAAQWAASLGITCIPVRSEPLKYGTKARVQRRKAIVQAALDVVGQGLPVLFVSAPGGDRELESMAKAHGLEVEDVVLETTQADVGVQP